MMCGAKIVKKSWAVLGVALLSFNVWSSPTFQQSFCAIDDNDRRTRALASLTDGEVREYVQKAEVGDVQAMAILASIPKKLPDGTLDRTRAPRFPEWLERAIAAGDKMLELRERRNAATSAGKWDEYEKATLDERIQAQEADALNGGEYSAFTLAMAYLNPSYSGWPENKKNMEKSLHWFRVAAGLGSRLAPMYLCDMSYNGLQHFGGIGGPDYPEAAKWCVLAAHVSCDSGGASKLSLMFEKGLGVPRNLAQALYWGKVSSDRREINRRLAQEMNNR